MIKIYLNANLDDSIRANAAIDIADRIYFSDLDSTYNLILQAKEWSIRSNYEFGLARVDGYLGFIYHGRREYSKAIEGYTTSINYNLENGFDLERAMDLGNYGALLDELNDPKSIDCLQQSVKIYEKYNMWEDLIYVYVNIGTYYSKRAETDSAIFYLRKGDHLSISQHSKMTVYSGLTESYLRQNQIDSARLYAKKSYNIGLELGDTTKIRSYFQTQMSMKLMENKIDSALYYGKIANSYQSNINLQLLQKFQIEMSQILFTKGRSRTTKEIS